MSVQDGVTLRACLLGTGSSGGVPRVGNDWGACDPDEPRNRRRRCGLLVERRQAGVEAPTRLLVDTPPDLREQLLDARVDALDAVAFTHDHADQTHGIDDVRALALRQRRPILAYLDAPTAGSLVAKFRYCFEGDGGYPPILERQRDIVPGEAFTVHGAGGDIDVLPLALEHGPIRSLGFRIGDFAYCNDVSAIPDAAMRALDGVQVFVVDALRYRPHPTHAHLEQALDWAARLGPRLTVLTNLHVDMDYRTLLEDLPDGVIPGHDGLWLEIPGCG